MISLMIIKTVLLNTETQESLGTFKLYSKGVDHLKLISPGFCIISEYAY